MLKQHSTFFRRSVIFIDLVLVGVCFALAYYLRSLKEQLDPFSYYAWFIPEFQILWGILLYRFGMYESFRARTLPEILTILGKTGFTGLWLFGSFSYLFKFSPLSRTFVILFFGLTTLIIAVEKIVIILFLRHVRKQGYNYRYVLVVGSGKRARDFIAELESHPELGMRVVGVIDHDRTRLDQQVSGKWVIGVYDDLPGILKKNTIDHVFFIVPRSGLSRIEGPLLYCETVGVTASVAVDLFDLQFTLGKESSIFGMPLVTFEPVPGRVGLMLVKRLLDIVLSLVGLVVVAPIYGAIALAIKISSKGGPVYFLQERCGLQGRKFQMCKFRTMVENAEDQLKDLLAQNEMQGPAFKLENDPRVTPLGKFLRKTSLDELPQLWNVLHGDMSLVGPRPPLPREVDQYDPWQRRRLSMRPGITCIWQANGRNRITDFNEWTRMDLEYIDNWSLMMDAKILFKTIPAVLLSRGAK